MSADTQLVIGTVVVLGIIAMLLILRIVWLEAQLKGIYERGSREMVGQMELGRSLEWRQKFAAVNPKWVKYLSHMDPNDAYWQTDGVVWREDDTFMPKLGDPR